MLDSWSVDGRGGTGESWDFSAAIPVIGKRRVFLAGGLRPETVSEVVRRYRPYGVDVSSGVESEVRVKDPSLMSEFVREVRRAEDIARETHEQG